MHGWRPDVVFQVVVHPWAISTMRACVHACESGNRGYSRPLLPHMVGEIFVRGDKFKRWAPATYSIIALRAHA